MTLTLDTEDVHQQISKEKFTELMGRYEEFRKILQDPNTAPIRVFDPLSKKKAEELELIREVSRDLQQKKDEHMLKLLNPEEPEETPKEEVQEEKKE